MFEDEPQVPKVPEFSQLPPQAIDLEEAVLSAMLIERDATTKVRELLTPETFYRPAHKMIFRAAIALFDNHKPVDLLTIMDRCTLDGTLHEIGGASYLAQLTSKVTSSANIEFHARILIEKHVRREVIIRMRQMERMAYNDTVDALSLLDKLTEEVVTLNNLVKLNSSEKIGTTAAKLINKILAYQQNPDDVGQAMYCGLATMEQGGFKLFPSDLIVLAARPAMGKTSFALQLGRKAAQDLNAGVAIFSLEMSADQLAGGMMCSDAKVDKGKLRNWERLSEDEIKSLTVTADQMDSWPIDIVETTGITPGRVRAKCREIKLDYERQNRAARQNALIQNRGVLPGEIVELKMVIIDYLQLMEADGRHGTREQEVSYISRQLKSLAKELEVPVVALSQLSRAVETRGGDKRPQLSDLRDSGSIEQDADQVWFLYRPEYYGITEDGQGNSLLNICEMVGGKNRHDEPQNIPLRFARNIGVFDDIDDGFDDIDLLPPSGYSGPPAENQLPAGDRNTGDQEVPF